MQTEIDPRSLIGHRAVDRAGQKLGTVDEVYLDDATGKPQWAAVRTGVFGHDALVPLEGGEVSNGELQIPYDRDLVKNAPDLGAGQHLSPDQEMQLYRHYGLRSGGTAEAAAGRGTAGGDRDFGRVAGEESGTAGTGRAQSMSAEADTAAMPAADRTRTMPASAEPSAARTSGTAGTASEASARRASSADAGHAMVRHEEFLEVDTERRAVGRARVRRYVVTEEVEHTVPVMHEEVRVVREPVENGAAGDGPADAFSESMEEVELHADSPVVHKVVRPVERLRLEVEEVRGEETVRDRVRKEQFEVLNDGTDEDRGMR